MAHAEDWGSYSPLVDYRMSSALKIRRTPSRSIELVHKKDKFAFDVHCRMYQLEQMIATRSTKQSPASSYPGNDASAPSNLAHLKCAQPFPADLDRPRNYHVSISAFHIGGSANHRIGCNL